MTTTAEQIDELDKTIEYENAILESAMAYPTETPQFYRAMENSRERIRKLYAERDRIAELEGGEKK